MSIDFRGVGRVHDTIAALVAVTFSVASGERVAITGPSGSGKSTLLHIAAGLDTGYSGAVVRSHPDGSVGYAFQDPRLLPWLSARRNVEFALAGTGLDRRESRARADEMLHLVELSSFAEDRPAALSGGMRQRVSLARALVVRAPLVLLDEPFSGLDEAQADRLCAAIRTETAGYGATVLMVTHRPREAALLADRAVVLKRGFTVADLAFSRSEPGIPAVDAEVSELVRRANMDTLVDEVS